MSVILTADDCMHEDLKERPTTALLRKNILTTLYKHYPHLSKWPIDVMSTSKTNPWVIGIDDFPAGQRVTIRNLLLHGRMGININAKDLDIEGRALVRYVGELIERYGIARTQGVDMRESLYNMPRDFRGDAIGQT